MASEKSKNNEQCPICLEELEGDDVIRLRCMHLFHKDCFGQLLIHRNQDYSFIKCPICRTETDVEGDVDYIEIPNYNISQKKTSIVNKKELELIFNEFLDLQEYLNEDSTTSFNKMDIDCGDFIDELLIVYKNKDDNEKEDIVSTGLQMCNDYKENGSSIKTGGKKRNKRKKSKSKKKHSTKRKKSRKTRKLFRKR